MSEPDARVDACQKQVDQARFNAEGALQRLLAQVATALQAWIPEQLRAETRRQHELAKPERIASLQRELISYGAELPKMIDGCFGKTDLWPHRQDFKRSDLGPAIPPRHVSGLRKPAGPGRLGEVLGKPLSESMAALLKRHGFDDRQHKGAVVLGVQFPWSEECWGLADAYSEAAEVFEAANTELAKATANRGAEAVDAMWNTK